MADQRRTRRRRQLLRRGLVVALLAGVAVVVIVSSGGDGGGGEGSATAPFVGGDLHSLVADPATPERLYVGGHEGVAVSTNGGKTWRQLASLDGADAMGWAFAGNKVLVGGHPGLFVSDDGGRTFQKRNDDLPATDIHALGAHGDIVYAASPQVGVFRSDDLGQSWQVVTESAGQSFMGRMLVDPDDAHHVIAADMRGGAAESRDGGRTWRELGGVSGAMWVSWDPAKTDHLLVSGMGEAAETVDGGQTWQPVDVPDGVSIVELLPDKPTTMLAGALDGTNARVWLSSDGGRTWVRP